VPYRKKQNENKTKCHLNFIILIGGGAWKKYPGGPLKMDNILCIFCVIISIKLNTKIILHAKI
jgi:hypothetical protein